jgi:pyruvate/2-oxoglutarate/acetoin dehydrogenase E1 component
MLMLSDADAIFIGQGVEYDGVATFADLDGVPTGQRIEMPVAEELQMGIGCGMAMQGKLVVSIYPRLDFLLRALDQLVNHLDKIEQMSRGQWKPKVIIRTRVGGKNPLDAGPQHTNNFTDAFRKMLTSVKVVELRKAKDAMKVYKAALAREGSTLIVENLC